MHQGSALRSSSKCHSHWHVYFTYCGPRAAAVGPEPTQCCLCCAQLNLPALLQSNETGRRSSSLCLSAWWKIVEEAVCFLARSWVLLPPSAPCTPQQVGDQNSGTEPTSIQLPLTSGLRRCPPDSTALEEKQQGEWQGGENPVHGCGGAARGWMRNGTREPWP